MTEANRVLGCIAKPRTLSIFPNTSPLISQLFEGTGNCSDLGCRIARTLLDNRRPRRRQLNSIDQHPAICTRASLILDCYSLEHWLPFFARTIRSPAETNRERISLAAFFRPDYSFPRGNE